MAAILPALLASTPRAEEVDHHGMIVDSESDVYECLSCHDGVIGKPITLSTMIGKYFCNHPVHRDYPPSDKADFYIPEEVLTSSGIKLVNGQITCISCHNLKNQEKFHLAVTIDRSDLCFKCHIK